MKQSILTFSRQHSKLFYEPHSRTYYAYDEEKREYRLHSRESADHLRRHCEQLFVCSGGQHAPPVRNVKKAKPRCVVLDSDDVIKLSLSSNQ